MRFRPLRLFAVWRAISVLDCGLQNAHGATRIGVIGVIGVIGCAATLIRHCEAWHKPWQSHHFWLWGLRGWSRRKKIRVVRGVRVVREALKVSPIGLIGLIGLICPIKLSTLHFQLLTTHFLKSFPLSVFRFPLSVFRFPFSVLNSQLSTPPKVFPLYGIFVFLRNFINFATC